MADTNTETATSTASTASTATATSASTYTVEPIESFDDMALNEDLLRGIYGFGFEKPSAIQERAIIPVTKGYDVIAQAQSGTGKTGAFSIGLLQKLDFTQHNLQAIVLLPTRELAQQVYTVVQGLSTYMEGFKAVLAIGGVMGGDQVRELQNGAQVMIGTPGRVYDLIANRAGPQIVNNLQTIVLDEADEMLSIGFQDQVREIFLVIPQSAQICLFSATLNPDVMDVSRKFMRDPVEILVRTENLTLDGIQQFYVKLREQDKFGCLMDLYESMTITQCLIYCNSRGRVEEIGNELTKSGFTVGAIHGQMSWDERKSVMDKFRSGGLRVLISTDLLARGIDVQQVSIVINYDIPRDVANYLHRIGRSGRFGRKGVGINFVTESSWESMEAICTHYKTDINELPADYASHI